MSAKSYLCKLIRCMLNEGPCGRKTDQTRWLHCGIASCNCVLLCSPSKTAGTETLKPTLSQFDLLLERFYCIAMIVRNANRVHSKGILGNFALGTALWICLRVALHCAADACAASLTCCWPGCASDWVCKAVTASISMAGSTPSRPVTCKGSQPGRSARLSDVLHVSHVQ